MYDAMSEESNEVAGPQIGWHHTLIRDLDSCCGVRRVKRKIKIPIEHIFQFYAFVYKNFLNPLTSSQVIRPENYLVPHKKMYCSRCITAVTCLRRYSPWKHPLTTPLCSCFGHRTSHRKADLEQLVQKWNDCLMQDRFLVDRFP